MIHLNKTFKSFYFLFAVVLMAGFGTAAQADGPGTSSDAVYVAPHPSTPGARADHSGTGAAPSADKTASDDETFSRNEIANAVAGFFGITTQKAAEVIEVIFSEQGRPNAYIKGEEASGAFIAGLRYGKGELVRKSGEEETIYWQGPSAGFDFGGDASKAFTLVYNLQDTEDMFRRYPGVEGKVYFVAGIGVNYQQRGKVVLAPMRTGVGWRQGVNAGYLKYSKFRRWVPF